MNDNWEVPDSDGEETYQPQPDIIVTLYKAIQKQMIPDLEVKIHPRRQPSIPENNNTADVEANESNSLPAPEDEINVAEESNEFDFDSQHIDTVKRFTRRNPSRPQTKKVARMDKVCSNIIKYQKMDEEQQQLEKQEKNE
ncbi:uncharacterized protein LOC143450139 [Clavelina lepadiformis]|uniref:Uncharacterized protein n=1 Tax=Clavelina lepadiformis TaxID=159417 RepID=A0ABP0GFP9_CLALP